MSSVSSRLIYFVIFSQNATELPAFQAATLLSFSNTKHAPHTEVFMHIKQVIFRVLEARGKHISSRSSHHFVPKDQNKLCTHDK